VRKEETAGTWAKRHERQGLGPKGHEQQGLGPKGHERLGLGSKGMSGWTWAKGARAAGWSELKEVQQEVQQHDTAGKADRGGSVRIQECRLKVAPYS
jgi:hypothetical protein